MAIKKKRKLFIDTEVRAKKSVEWGYQHVGYESI